MLQRIWNILQRSWPIMVLLLVVSVWLLMRYAFSDQEPQAGDSRIVDITVQSESCFECHVGMKGFSKFHEPSNIGCVVCHLGDPNTSDKDRSHKDMVLIPGNLDDAEQTCGTCHPNELHKIQHSLMTTNSGLVAVDKYVFGETDSPDHHFDIRELAHSKADDHIRDLCANCHLGAEKQDLGPITELSRGGGCNACHLNYSEQAEHELAAYLDSNKNTLPSIHPSTDINMSDKHCFGCHSRSSRISTNYMGWHETLLEEDEVLPDRNLKVFEDKRVYEYKGVDVHHSKGLLCIDCHSSHEVMGDGKDYLHEEDAVSLNCSDCHVKDTPNTITYGELDQESLLVFMHRGYSHNDREMLAVKEDAHPLVNTVVETDGEIYLIGKKDGKRHLIKKQGEVCARDEAHASLSCSSCHSGWAPRCIGCHNTYDNMKQGYDLLDKKMIKGTWVEHVYEFGSGLPAMGVRTTEGGKHIEPAVPGMILTIDHSGHPEGGNDKKDFTRLYAPNAPHTTTSEVRSCTSCHADASSIGYGKGKLQYKLGATSGTWIFDPEYATNKIDGLPEDAWIPFLKDYQVKMQSTRSDFRPFNIAEQQRILTVGACLQCHDEESKVIEESLIIGLNPLLLKLSDKCLLPDF